jgi:methyltransferase
VLTILVALVGFVALTRLAELRLSTLHRRALHASGARTVDEPGFFAMVLLHAGVLTGSIVEPIASGRTVPVWFGLAAALGVLLANGLRLWAIKSLGPHWNVRVVDSTALGIVHSGPYRFVRHPNYVAVFLELLLLPLVQGAWFTAILGTALHVVVLRRRLFLEEVVLFAHPAYCATMGPKPRFIPRLFEVTREPAATERP